MEPITPQAHPSAASLNSYVHVLLLFMLVSVIVNGLRQILGMGLGNGDCALSNADGHAVPETGQISVPLSETRRFTSCKRTTQLILSMFYFMTTTQGALGLEETDRLSASSDQDTTSAANNELGWPFGPGLPPFDGWPFILFGLAFVIAALSLTMIKRSKRAAVFGIGTAVSNYLGLTIMADDKMTPVVMWTMVAIELFFAFAYGVVNCGKRDLVKGWQLIILLMTCVFSMVSILTMKGDHPGVTKVDFARFIPPSFSLSLFSYYSGHTILSGKNDSDDDVHGVTTLRDQEEGSIPHATGPNRLTPADSRHGRGQWSRQ